MGKQYELKLFLKLSQNGHKICYCPVDILEMECIIVRVPSVGRQERHTLFYLHSFQTLNLTKIKIKIVYLTINFFLLKITAITKYA